jgi:hypothetical protein
VLDVCDWREGGREESGSGLPARPAERAQRFFGENNPRHGEHLDFLFNALDVWVDRDIQSFFESFFTTIPSTPGIRLFDAPNVDGAPDVNLFRACCKLYGEYRGTAPRYSLPNTLLLYATLVHLIEETSTEDASRRLRQLRNLNELTRLTGENMPKLIPKVEELMEGGSLDDLGAFNGNQVADERRKQEFLAMHPGAPRAVERLEDHEILRRTLAVIDLDDAVTVAARADAFERAFAREHLVKLTGALLAKGDYHRRGRHRTDRHRFGSPDRWVWWRAVLVDRGEHENLAETRRVLGLLLDTLAVSEPVAEQLDAIADEFIVQRQTNADFDWRYYFVRYPWMREGRSGIYFGPDELGYELTMLQGKSQNGWYRDPYLYAIWCESGRPGEVGTTWFKGWWNKKRWMRLKRSGTGLRSARRGIEVQPPPDAYRATFDCVRRRHTDLAETEDVWLLEVDQHEDGIDAEDRVQKAESFLRELLAYGL